MHINDSCNNRGMFDSCRMGYDHNKTEVEANKNCSFCTVAPFFNTPVSRLKHSLGIKSITGESNHDIAECIILKGEEITPQGQLRSMTKIVCSDKRFNYESIKLYQSVIIETEEDFTDLLDAYDNVGIMCYIYAFSSSVTHFLYGQKIKGQLEFIDFQQDKGIGVYPKVHSLPTGYDFDQESYITLREMIDAGDVSVSLSIIRAYPAAIQARINKFRRGYMDDSMSHISEASSEQYSNSSQHRSCSVISRRRRSSVHSNSSHLAEEIKILQQQWLALIEIASTATKTPEKRKKLAELKVFDVTAKNIAILFVISMAHNRNRYQLLRNSTASGEALKVYMNSQRFRNSALAEYIASLLPELRDKNNTLTHITQDKLRFYGEALMSWSPASREDSSIHYDRKLNFKSRERSFQLKKFDVFS